MLNIALPKGRLGDKVYAMMKRAGYPCPDLENPDRRLIFEILQAGVRYFWVKPSDVTIYVERGAADLGIAGKDIILENRPDIYELLDLNIGVCRMAVAAPEGFRDDREQTLRVATKFPNIAGDYYAAKARDVELIRLNGSIEIAPILGLSDVIVDIVETGKTLRENGLTVLETVCPISARLVANPAAYRFQRAEIDLLAERLGREIQDA
jgi:ATP phosphoribosyltransferase